MHIRVLRKVFQSLHSHEEAQIVNIHLCLLVCLHFTVCRHHHGRGFWISVEFPFHLRSNPCCLCIEVPESITNFLSSCNFEVGATIALASRGAERITLMRLALLSDPSGWTLSCPNFYSVPCPFWRIFSA